MGMAYYDAKEFKELQATWYKKLEESGFDDAENQKNGISYLRSWHSTYFQTKHSPDRFQAKEVYYQIASRMLHTHPFPSVFEECVWMLHVEGTSLREIASVMGATVHRVHTTVKRVCKSMANFDKMNELLEDE